MRKAKVLKKLWIVHPESECIFVGTIKDIEREPLCMEIGFAIKGTKEEVLTLYKKEDRKFVEDNYIIEEELL